jgi:ribonuclease E
VPTSSMLINFVPGDECRVAVTTNGKLEELFSERLTNTSNVGSIYVGRVVNVEPSIQAAFIDFGLEQNGFLHISDLHPRYFPGEDGETTEKVGKKTPRRERPPIQDALRRGQEIAVQVIKEGIGSKGPTLTSYLSIPGRFLVMMPDMDRVGVSRKVESEDQRKEARLILDTLELPSGFGFILRTAGIGKTKTDLKRDLAYLQRLWKDMERSRKAGSKPRLLYTESDLVIRCLRDVLTNDITEIIIDHPFALNRASQFLKIVAPRSSTRLMHFNKSEPLFHAYGIESQIKAIHSREVLLPSGGRLVIDETEALVAIDVNSGKSRSASDAETTSYRTNMEAASEICRQLRLRDLGGLVVLDLIDMRSRSNRRDVETKFKTLFKLDRARTKLLPISQLGLLELTRQRMRGSIRSVNFSECRLCHGVGTVQRPESLASDATRELARIIHHEPVKRVELVVPPKVAGDLLSRKRMFLARLEKMTGKQIDVRVSETMASDHVSFYAYDERGADIDIDRMPTLKPPTDLPDWQHDGSVGEWDTDPSELELDEELLKEHDEFDPLLSDEDDDQPKRRNRRRRRRRRSGDSQSEESTASTKDETASETPASEGEAKPAKKRRRRRRRPASDEATPQGTSPDEAPMPESTQTEQKSDSAPRRRRRRSSRSSDTPEQTPKAATAPTKDAAASSAENTPSPTTKKKTRRRRSSSSSKKKSSSTSTTAKPPTEAPAQTTPASTKKTSRRRRPSSNSSTTNSSSS